MKIKFGNIYQYDNNNFINSVDIKKRIYQRSEELKKYSKLKDTVYIDLILREGNSILIPNFWLFSTRNEDTNITLYSKVDTVLTHVLQLPYAVEKSLHYMGLYKVNNCYCHKCVKG